MHVLLMLARGMEGWIKLGRDWSGLGAWLRHVLPTLVRFEWEGLE